MKLNFVYLSIKNFKSFAQATLSLDRYGSGLHFLRGQNKVEPQLGANGTGKSSLWDAVCWCLYGRTVNELRNPDIKPWNGDKHTEVDLVLHLGDKSYAIGRSTFPNRISLDNKEVTQEVITELLGMSFEVFTHTILLGQGRPLFFDLQPRERMALFSEVLNLERWEQRSKAAGESASELDHEESTLTGELSSLETQLSETKESLRLVKESAASWREDKQASVKKLEKELAELRKLEEKLANQFSKADSLYDEAETELRALQKSSTQLRDTHNQLSQDVATAKHKIRLKEERIAELKKEIAFLGQTDKCPTCGQSIKGTDLGKHKREIETRIKAIEAEIKKGQPIKELKQLDEARTLLKQTHTHEEEFRIKINRALDDRDAITPQLTRTKASILATNSLLKQDREQSNPFTQQVSDLRHKIGKLEADLEDRQERLQKVQRMAERRRFWVKGFKDVRLYIIEDVLQELQLTTNVLLEEVGLIDWEVHYAIERETKKGTIQSGLNTTIRSPDSKGEVKWESWSGGEGQRLRLISALALSEVLLARAGVETDLEVLDEPTAHLSTEGVHDVVEFLANRAEQFDRQIWFVDHTAVESAHFASTLTVIKDAKGSRLL